MWLEVTKKSLSQYQSKAHIFAVAENKRAQCLMFLQSAGMQTKPTACVWFCLFWVFFQEGTKFLASIKMADVPPVILV